MLLKKVVIYCITFEQFFIIQDMSLWIVTVVTFLAKREGHTVISIAHAGGQPQENYVKGTS